METLEIRLASDYRICEPASLHPRIIILGITEESLKEEINGANKQIN